MLIIKTMQQLGHPTKTLGGWLISQFLKWHNKILEENAVNLCEIGPNDTVLEVGYGPGLGLMAAAPLLSGPKGKLIGVDYSEYMYKMATKRAESFITSGKVTLHLGSVTAMPIPDNSVDKVFHCNCHFYWPDLRAGIMEIHRVMKPGAFMVTAARLDQMAYVTSKVELPQFNWRPEVYMKTLQEIGFVDIRMEDKVDKGTKFKAIFATACK